MNKHLPITPATALRLARHSGIDIRQAQHNQWLTENKDALNEYNRRIESNGTFSDGLRRF